MAYNGWVFQKVLMLRPSSAGQAVALLLLSSRPWLTVLVAFFICSSVTQAQNSVTTYPVPTRTAGPTSIVVGPDGNLWFIEAFANKVGRMTPSGSFIEVPLVSQNAMAASLVSGPDGNLWLAEVEYNKVARITPAGGVTEFSLTPNSLAISIAAGPDGNLWVGEIPSNVVKLSPAGAILAEYKGPAPPATGNLDYGAVVGPDGNLWFVDDSHGNIVKFTTGGVATVYPVPTPNPKIGGIALGADGNIWFLEFNAQKIGKITTRGVITEYPAPAPLRGGITSSPDGNIWVTEATKLASITPSGKLTEYALPAGLDPNSIAADSAGNLWFTAFQANVIGKFVPPPNPSVTVSPLSLTFGQSPGGPVPPPQTVSLIGSASGATFQANIASSQACAWLQLSPSTGPAAGLVTFSVQPNSLAQNTYVCPVIFSFANSVTLPISVTVTLVVAPPPLGFTYDASGRLITANYGVSGIFTYSYDAAGNLIGRSVKTGTVTQSRTSGGKK